MLCRILFSVGKTETPSNQIQPVLIPLLQPLDRILDFDAIKFERSDICFRNRWLLQNRLRLVHQSLQPLQRRTHRTPDSTGHNQKSTNTPQESLKNLTTNSTPIYQIRPKTASGTTFVGKTETPSTIFGQREGTTDSPV